MHPRFTQTWTGCCLCWGRCFLSASSEPSEFLSWWFLSFLASWSCSWSMFLTMDNMSWIFLKRVNGMLWDAFFWISNLNQPNELWERTQYWYFSWHDNRLGLCVGKNLKKLEAQIPSFAAYTCHGCSKWRPHEVFNCFDVNVDAILLYFDGIRCFSLL